jgi:hypothetical protein
MREGLGAFEPTEWEFRELFKARKSFDDQFRFTREGSDQATREQRRAAEDQLDQQIRATLGEDRYAQYKMANDEQFRDIYDFTERANLPRSTAESVYEVRRIAEAERQRVLSDPNMTPEQRKDILTRLAAETRGTISATLGNSYPAFSRNNRWLERFDQLPERDRRGDPQRNRRG